MTAGDRARAVVAKQLGLDIERIVDGARFDVDLGTDELERIEIVMEIEAAFGIEIDDATMETFATVGDLIAFLERSPR